MLKEIYCTKKNYEKYKKYYTKIKKNTYISHTQTKNFFIN